MEGGAENERRKTVVGICLEHAPAQEVETLRIRRKRASAKGRREAAQQATSPVVIRVIYSTKNVGPTYLELLLLYVVFANELASDGRTLLFRYITSDNFEYVGLAPFDHPKDICVCVICALCLCNNYIYIYIYMLACILTFLKR